MYLLSTQCLLDRITGEAPASVDAFPAREIHLSAVSIAQAQFAIENAAVADRQGHLDAMRGYVGMVRSFDNLVPFDERSAAFWVNLRGRNLVTTRPDGAQIRLSEVTTMVVASALALNLTLVDYPQPFHGQVPGLVVTNP